MRESDSPATVLSAIWDIVQDPQLDDDTRRHAAFVYLLFADANLILSSRLGVSIEQWFQELDAFMQAKQTATPLSRIEMDTIQEFGRLRAQRIVDHLETQ